jgi:glycosyltransferase involved in cell wall biosynthesis
MVYAEALAVGLPVLAFEPSAVADFVRRDGSGWATSWSNDLGATLQYAARRFPGMRETCRRVFDENYTEHAFVNRIVSVYRSVLAESRL